MICEHPDLGARLSIVDDHEADVCSAPTSWAPCLNVQDHRCNRRFQYENVEAQHRQACQRRNDHHVIG